MKKTKEEAITLIALIITVIIMLILGGVAINIGIGDNGIFKKTQEASEISKKAGLKEELELKITDLEMEKIKRGQTLTKEELVEKLPDIGVLVVDHTNQIIEGEYEDYQITIDEKTEVTIGAKLTGVKPIVQFSITPTTQGVEVVELQVIASTQEGEIVAIESLNNLTPKTENSNADKIYEVTENGEYKFKIIGSNGRIAIEKTTITNLINESESLFQAISEIEQSGETKVKVVGSQSTEIYSLNVIKQEGDMVLDGTTTYEGANLANNAYEFGDSTQDIGKNTVVLKVEGDLTINNGITLTSVKGNGGPKGLIVYCTGTITNNGTMSMSARGARVEGQNVYIYKKADNTFEFVPKAGAVGATGVAINADACASGRVGGNGTARQTGGGGSGATGRAGGSGVVTSGAGSAGTSYSGGNRRRRRLLVER